MTSISYNNNITSRLNSRHGYILLDLLRRGFIQETQIRKRRSNRFCCVGGCRRRLPDISSMLVAMTTIWEIDRMTFLDEELLLSTVPTQRWKSGTRAFRVILDVPSDHLTWYNSSFNIKTFERLQRYLYSTSSSPLNQSICQCVVISIATTLTDAPASVTVFKPCTHLQPEPSMSHGSWGKIHILCIGQCEQIICKEQRKNQHKRAILLGRYKYCWSVTVGGKWTIVHLTRGWKHICCWDRIQEY